MTLFGNIFPPLGSLVGLASHFYALHFPAAAERRLSLLPDLTFHRYLCRGASERVRERDSHFRSSHVLRCMHEYIQPLLRFYHTLFVKPKVRVIQMNHNFTRYCSPILHRMDAS